MTLIWIFAILWSITTGIAINRHETLREERRELRVARFEARWFEGVTNRQQQELTLVKERLREARLLRS